MSEEFEELEQIPWAALAAKTPDPRLRMALVVISACCIALVLLVAGKVMLSRGGDSVDVPATPSQQLAAAAPQPAPEPSNSAVEQDVAASTPAVPAPAASAAYSEADLMAISLDTEERLAAMWAEWFVRDYLANDGGDSIGAGWGDALGIEQSPGTVPVFVEWVEAFAVTTPSSATYRVEVAYRILVEAGNGFVRQPTAALGVDVAIGTDGEVRLLQIPEIVPPPQGSSDINLKTAADLPATVTEALDYLPASVDVAGGYEQNSRWHLAVFGEIVPGVTRLHRIETPNS